MGQPAISFFHGQNNNGEKVLDGKRLLTAYTLSIILHGTAV